MNCSSLSTRQVGFGGSSVKFWGNLFRVDSGRFACSPSISDSSTIIDDDLDSELEFLASASSVMVNPVPTVLTSSDGPYVTL